MGIILGGVSASDLILDGRSVSLYVGGNPPTKVWPTRETVQITLGTDLEARDQFRAALADRGLDYQTVEEIPFDIELVGTGSARDMFRGCSALTAVPEMDTSGVTNMRSMFNACSSLTSVPPMDTSQVTNMAWMFTHSYALTSIPAMDTSRVTAMNNMFDQCPSLTYVPGMDTSNVTNVNNMFYGCSALTDGNVRLIGKHPNVSTANMITNSGLTREPWYNADGTPLRPRKVTINAGGNGASFVKPATGDVSLIGDWRDNSGELGASFVAPVTCNRDVRSLTNFSAIRAGATIPAGQAVSPPYAPKEPPYVFTEAW